MPVLVAFVDFAATLSLFVDFAARKMFVRIFFISCALPTFLSKNIPHESAIKFSSKKKAIILIKSILINKVLLYNVGHTLIRQWSSLVTL